MVGLMVQRILKHRHACLLFTMDPDGFFTMDFLLNSLNAILVWLVLSELDLVGELVFPQFWNCFPRIWKHRYACFIMDSEMLFTMDFLLNSLDIILGELVWSNLNLVREFMAKQI